MHKSSYWMSDTVPQLNADSIPIKVGDRNFTNSYKF